jgi:hypothetical protein
MPGRENDPYAVLGVPPSASDAELHAAYRRLVKLHHPDHNGGSEESERRFEEVQDAYARARSLRAGSPPPRRSTPPPRAAAAGVDARVAEMERQLREARAATERAEQARRQARQAARDAAVAAAGGERRRASDEELGYVSTDDSFSKILADASDAIAGRLSDARESSTAKRFEDLLDELADKLKGDGKGS